MNLENRPSIEDVYDHYGRRILPGSRDWQKAECPLLSHEDRNPSASVNVEAGKFNCFSCDKHGDVFDIVKENENLARLADVVRFCQENFDASERAVRPEPGYSGSLSVGKGRRKSGGKFVPAWRRL